MGAQPFYATVVAVRDEADCKEGVRQSKSDDAAKNKVQVMLNLFQHLCAAEIPVCGMPNYLLQ